MNVVFTRSALKQFKKIDITNQKKIKQFILDIQELNDPRSKGKALKGKLSASFLDSFLSLPTHYSLRGQCHLFKQIITSSYKTAQWLTMTRNENLNSLL